MSGTSYEVVLKAFFFFFLNTPTDIQSKYPNSWQQVLLATQKQNKKNCSLSRHRQLLSSQRWAVIHL